MQDAADEQAAQEVSDFAEAAAHAVDTAITTALADAASTDPAITAALAAAIPGVGSTNPSGSANVALSPSSASGGPTQLTGTSSSQTITTTTNAAPDATQKAFQIPVAAPVVAAETSAIADFLAWLGLPVMLLFPTPTGEDNQQFTVFHYTTNEGAQSILAAGQINVGSASGVAWVTPTAYDSSAAAQSDLSLPTTPDGYFAIPGQNIDTKGISWGAAAPQYGQPGGGIEGTTAQPIPITGAVWIPLPHK